MTLLVPANNRKSIAQSLVGGLVEGLSPALQQYQQQRKSAQEQQALSRLTGMDLSGVSPDIRNTFISEHLKGQSALEKERLKQQLKIQGQKELFNLIDLGDQGDQGSPDQPPSSEEDGSINKPPNILDSDRPSRKKPIPDSAIAKISLVHPALAHELREQNKSAMKEEQHRQETGEKKFEADRAFHSKYSDPILADASKVLQEAPTKRALLDQQRRDIASGETSGLIPYLVEKTGIEAWRNPESARFKTIGKQRFIEGLNSIGGGARPNQFIEQQLIGAQAALGRDPEANQTILDLEEFIDDMKTQRSKYVRQLAEEDQEKYGYVRRDIDSRADKLMEDYADNRQDQMAYTIRKRKEDNLSDEQLARDITSGKVAADTPLTLRAARVLMIKNNDDADKAYAEAKRLGFKIPKESTYQATP